MVSNDVSLLYRPAVSSVCSDQEVVAKLTELDMMVADLEQANSRVATVERRNVRQLSLVYLYNS